MPSAHPRSPWRIAAPMMLAADLLVLAVMLRLQAAGCPALVDPSEFDVPASAFAQIFLVAAGLAFGLLGALIVHYRAENPIGRLCTIIGLSIFLMSLPLEYATCGRDGLGGPKPGWEAAAWLANLSTLLTLFYIFVLLPLIFPNGRFLSERWRRFLHVCLGVLAAFLLLSSIWPGALFILEAVDAGQYPNPLAVPAFNPPQALDRLLRQTPNLFIVIAGVIASFSLVLRLIHATGDTRQQIKWFAFFQITFVTLLMIIEGVGALIYPAIFNSWIYLVGLLTGWVGYPVVIGLAVFKYRLYDIDLIIRRTLIFALVTSALAVVYFLSVLIFQQMIRAITGQESPLAVVLSTLAIAALFTPVRVRMQDTINRRFYRRRYDAEQTITTFSADIRDEVDASALSERLIITVQETMQPESASLWVRKL